MFVYIYCRFLSRPQTYRCEASTLDGAIAEVNEKIFSTEMTADNNPIAFVDFASGVIHKARLFFEPLRIGVGDSFPVKSEERYQFLFRSVDESHASFAVTERFFNADSSLAAVARQADQLIRYAHEDVKPLAIIDWEEKKAQLVIRHEGVSHLIEHEPDFPVGVNTLPTDPEYQRKAL